MKRIVLITGVSGGIGIATAKLFSENGWYVIGVDLQNPDNSSHIDHFILRNLSEAKEIEKIFEEIIETESHINALINNAAIQVCKPLVEILPAEWENLIRINLTSVYLSMRQAYPLMAKYGGAIVNISSVHAVATSKNISSYAASKGALLSLTRAMAIEFADNNIRVNAVLPGAVDTSMLRDGLKRCVYNGDLNPFDELCKRTPLGRVGKPEEIAEAILFLSENKSSSYITGQLLIVDGGATAKLSTE